MRRRRKAKHQGHRGRRRGGGRPQSLHPHQSFPINPNQSQSIPTNPNQSQSIPINPNQSPPIPINPHQSPSIPINPLQSPTLLHYTLLAVVFSLPVHGVPGTERPGGRTRPAPNGSESGPRLCSCTRRSGKSAPTTRDNEGKGEKGVNAGKNLVTSRRHPWRPGDTHAGQPCRFRSDTPFGRPPGEFACPATARQRSVGVRSKDKQSGQMQLSPSIPAANAQAYLLKVTPPVHDIKTIG